MFSWKSLYLYRLFLHAPPQINNFFCKSTMMFAAHLFSCMKWVKENWYKYKSKPSAGHFNFVAHLEKCVGQML